MTSGQPVNAYILIQTEVGKAAAVAAEIAGISGVTTAEDVTGPYDVIVRAEAPDRGRIGQAGRRPDPGGRRNHADTDLPGRSPVAGTPSTPALAATPSSRLRSLSRSPSSSLSLWAG